MDRDASLVVCRPKCEATSHQIRAATLALIISTGIYLDDGSYNVRVHHNVIVGSGQTRSGLFSHMGDRRIEVYNNTFGSSAESVGTNPLKTEFASANDGIFERKHQGCKSLSV